MGDEQSKALFEATVLEDALNSINDAWVSVVRLGVEYSGTVGVIAEAYQAVWQQKHVAENRAKQSGGER